MIRRFLPAGILVALMVAGCSSATPALEEKPGTAFSSGGDAATPPASSPALPDPTGLDIPKIGVHATSLTKLTLDQDDVLVPPPVDQPMQAGWYAGRDPAFDGDEYKPGEVGPAVIAGHVDGIVNGTNGHPGIFKRLKELAPGDEVIVQRGSEHPLTFVVYAVERHAKDRFPTDRVYAMTTDPELRLITCGGEFNYQTRHYEDNWIAWAKLKV